MRVPDWEIRFLELFKVASKRPFLWGEFDCCMFAADAVIAQVGVDPAAAFRGSYSSALCAVRCLQKHLATGETLMDDLVVLLVEDISKEHSFAEVAPLCAQRGDVVLIDMPSEDNLSARGLGVVDMTGRRVAVPGLVGLIRFPLSDGIRAWRVQ